jgi:hypothetical protein
VYFKSGSLFECAPEPGFTCRPYAGNVKNYMNSTAIIESPAAERKLYYMSTLVTNILRKNSAVEHQTPDRATTQQIFELGKLGAGVHTRDFARIVMLIQADLFMIVPENSRNISEIVFALAVDWLYALERSEQRLLPLGVLEQHGEFGSWRVHGDARG